MGGGLDGRYAAVRTGFRCNDSIIIIIIFLGSHGSGFKLIKATGGSQDWQNVCSAITYGLRRQLFALPRCKALNLSHTGLDLSLGQLRGWRVVYQAVHTV